MQAAAIKPYIILLIIVWTGPTMASNGPTPTGPFGIGTKRVFIHDETRPEILTNDSDDSRKLVVQVFYPTNSTASSSQLETSYHKVKYHHRIDAPIATSNTPMPIIILCPGLGGHFLMNMSLAEELASNGYYVLNIGHSYLNKTPIRPDGSELPLMGMDTFKLNESNPISSAFRSTINTYVRIETEDIKTVLKQIKTIAGDHSTLVDFEQIAAIGYSAGGAASADACTEVSTLKAGININGVMYGNGHKQKLSQPFLYVNADYKSPKKAELEMLGGQQTIDSLMAIYNRRKLALKLRSTAPFYELTLTHTTHHNFSDFGLVDHSVTGKSNPTKTLEITYQYIVAFLNKHLKGSSSFPIDHSVKNKKLEWIVQ